MNESKRVLFLDGMGCNPEGFKPRYIASLGYSVLAPQLPDLDFPASIEVANRAVETFSPHVVVGYSRGAGVAMMLEDRRTPRLLIAPSLHWVADNRGFDGRLVILHSATDDGIPLEEVREQLVRCRMANADLSVLGIDHTMIDDAALAALTAGLAELSQPRA